MQQQPINVFPNPAAMQQQQQLHPQMQIIQQPVPTPPVFAPPPPVVPVYPEGQIPVAQQVRKYLYKYLQTDK